MVQEDLQTHFSKSVMAGLFAGIVATLANLIFNVFFREYTGYPLNELINVSSIIFACCLLGTIAGLIYYVLDRYLKAGSVIYIVLFTALTLLGMRAAFHVQRSGNPAWNTEFSELFLGVILICGLTAAFIVPYLVKKDNGVV